MESLYVIAPVSALSKRLRLYKLVSYIHNQYPNCKIKHLGWERNLGESVEDRLSTVKIEKKVLLKGGGYGGKKVKLMYLLWMARVFTHSFFIPKGTKVWALGFETAFPLLPMSKIKKFDIYFDDADRFSMVFRFPQPMKSLIQKLEEFTSRNVYKHIVPSLSRYDFESSKFFVLKNLPSEKELIHAKNIYADKIWPKSKLVIYVNGWLGKNRGMDVALKISKAFNVEDLIILLAGRIDCEEAKELSHQPNVKYLGELNNAEALAVYYASDYVLTYYNPNVEINRLAESNKWGDAKATGCGVIVNKEVSSFIGSANDIVCPYLSTDLLITVLKELKRKDKESKLKTEFFESNLKKLLG